MSQQAAAESPAAATLREAATELERLWELGRTPHNQLTARQRADYAAYRETQSTADWLRARAAAEEQQ